MIYGDYHTHTVYSHGKGTIMENALAAKRLGIKQIAITDHGFRHVAYNVRRIDWPYVLKDIKKANESSGVEVLVGMESNLIDSKGKLDISSGDISDFDVLVCGYHKFAHTSNLAEYFKFGLPIFMSGLMHKSSAKRIAANTDAFIKAMERYPIDIISHPNTGIKINLKELARAASHYKTYLELNGKRISFSTLDFETMLSEGASFIMNSDAHSPGKVGDVSKPLAFLSSSGIPLDRIANWDKTPIFKDKKQYKKS